MTLLNQSSGGANFRAAIDTLAWLIEDAFQGDPSHSLLANLRDLRDEDWTALPPGGDQPPLVPAQSLRSRPHDELLAWLTEGQRRWLASVRALSNDAELDRDRLTNWGERLLTRVIVRIMIAHDLYHAGEINHLRALLHGSDRWPY